MANPAINNHETHTGQRIPEAVIDEIATSPNAPQDVPALLKKIATNGEVFTSERSDENTRMDLLEQARALVYALETPREAMIRFCWSQVRSYFHQHRQSVQHCRLTVSYDAVTLGYS